MSQSLSKILVHLVFSTKHRAPLILPEFEDKLHGYMVGILKELDSPLIQIGGTSDHVHLLFNLSKNRALTEVIQEVKGSSSKWIRSQPHCPSEFFWQGGYGAFSIGQSNFDDVREYIANQKEHHKKRSFQDELRLLLSKYGVEFDERYIWD